MHRRENIKGNEVPKKDKELGKKEGDKEVEAKAQIGTVSGTNPVSAPLQVLPKPPPGKVSGMSPVSALLPSPGAGWIQVFLEKLHFFLLFFSMKMTPISLFMFH